MIEVAALEGSPPQGIPAAHLCEIGEMAVRCRDQIFDLLVRLSQRPSFEGFLQTPELAPHLWESLVTDPDPFMMSLDFLVTDEGVRLARVVGPWASLPQALQRDVGLRKELSGYIKRRFAPDGLVAVRSLDYGSRFGDGVILTRAITNAGMDAQAADLNADWDDAAELSGAWMQAPLFGAMAGMFSLPPENVRLFAPLWTSLLDEPGLLVYLHRAYEDEECYGPATFTPMGRTIGEQTGVQVRRAMGVHQDLGYLARPERLDLLRYFVDDERVLGCSVLRDAQLRHAASGVVTGVVAQWEP